MNPFREKLLQAVAQLEIRSRRSIASLLAGDYRSSFRGSGMQFKEFRHYEAGDDIRHMSWPVTARTGRATVKIYEEERELNVLVMVDVSGSTLFGDRHRRKIDMYAEVAALLGLAAVKSGIPRRSACATATCCNGWTRAIACPARLPRARWTTKRDNPPCQAPRASP